MGTIFKETKIGRIPKDWEAVILGKITQVRGGIGFPLEYQGTLTGTYPLYKVSDMTLPGNEVYMQSANNYVDSHVARELRATIFPAQTVIFPKVGAAVYTNKKRMLSCEALIDNNVMGVTVKAIDRCLPYFIYTYFQTIDLTTLSNPGPLPSINAKRINSMEIPLPPLPEQRKIAEILSTVDEAIEKTDAIIQETQQLKKGLMQKLFTEGIGHTQFKETKIGRMPEGWDYDILGNVAKVKGGKRLPKGDQFAGTRTPYPYIRIVDFRNMSVATGELEYLKEKTQKSIAKYTISSSDVYISIAGTIGLVGIVPDELDGANLTENAAKICNLEKINKVFLAYFLSSPITQKQIDSFVGISTQPKLALNRIEKIQLPVPDLDEQCKIADILSEVNARIETEQAFKSELEQLMKGLMQVLLTGKVRVKI